MVESVDGDCGIRRVRVDGRDHVLTPLRLAKPRQKVSLSEVQVLYAALRRPLKERWRDCKRCAVNLGDIEVGDFNGDGHADLMVLGWSFNIDEEDADRRVAILVMAGGPNGLQTDAVEILEAPYSRIGGAVPGSPALAALSPSEYIWGLAVGDADHDGNDDLAVAVIGEAAGGMRSGRPLVVYGAEDGLGSGRPTQVWHRDLPGVAGRDQDATQVSVAFGDLNGDGFSDLVTGYPDDYSMDQNDAGRVGVIYGTRDGLTPAGAQEWSKDSSGVPGRTDSADKLGTSLATGDFDGDGTDDLAVSGSQDSPTVTVLYGTPHGLTARHSQVWTPTTAAFRWCQRPPGPCRSGPAATTRRRQGWTLTTGWFDPDPYQDLAVVYPPTGDRTLLYGSADGLTTR